MIVRRLASRRMLSSVPSVIHAVPPNTPPTQSTSTHRLQNHYFDTFHIVTRLEAASFKHGQAVSLMNAIRALLVNATEIAKAETLSKSDAENTTYLFRAAMDELKTEIQTLRVREATQLRVDAMGLLRALETLQQKMNEDLQVMRTDVEMDVEMRRSAIRSESKDIELRIQELDNKFTVKLGDLRTAMERYKWDATRRLLLALVGLAVIGTYIINRPRKQPEETEFVPDEGDSRPGPGNTFISLG